MYDTEMAAIDMHAVSQGVGGEGRVRVRRLEKGWWRQIGVVGV